MKIAAAGYVSLDITPTFPDTGQKYPLSEVLIPGKLIEVGQPTIAVGGSVSNTGLALHKFGAETLLLTKIGNDSFGGLVLEQYCKNSADISNIVISDGSSTSYTIALAVPGNDRVFLADPGANNEFSTKDINFDALRDLSIFHFGYPTLMKCFYKNDGDELVSLFKKLKSMGIITSMDIAMVDPLSESGRQNWPLIFEKVLPYVDIFTPSFEELLFLLDRNKYEEIKKRSGNDDICRYLSLENDIIPLSDKALSLGCKMIFLKCGAPGMYLKTRSKDNLKSLSSVFDSSWADLSIFEKSYVPDRICSGTGAGDTSIAAFLYSISIGRSPEQCLHNAAATGAMNLTAYDSLSGLLPIDELEKKIENGWEKLDLLRK